MVILLLFLRLFWASGYSAEFTEEIKKDFSLRSLGSLQITNIRGSIRVKSHPLNRVRVRIVKKIISDKREQSKFNEMGFRYETSGDNIEIVTEYAKTVNIEQRMNDKSNPKSSIDLYVYAPSKIKLKIWTVDGQVDLKNWDSSVEIRSNTGAIQAQDIKADTFVAFCPSCKIDLKNVYSSVRCSGGSETVNVHNIRGERLFFETNSAPLKATHIKGEQIYVSKSGSIFGQYLQGQIGFQVEQASVELKEVSGSINGIVDKGDVTASLSDSNVENKISIETKIGNLNLAVPRRFSSEMDLWSQNGKVTVDIPYEKLQNTNTFGPEDPGHIMGRVRDGEGFLKGVSRRGDIHLFKKI